MAALGLMGIGRATGKSLWQLEEKNPTGLKLILGFTLAGWDLESRAHGTVPAQPDGAQPASRLATCTLPGQSGYLESGALQAQSSAPVGQKLAKEEEITSETNKGKNPLQQKVFILQEGTTGTRKWQCSKWSCHFCHGKGKGQNHSPIQALTVLSGSWLPKFLAGVVTPLYAFLKFVCLWRT